MGRVHLHTKTDLVAIGPLSGAPGDTSAGLGATWRALRRWWKQQIAFLVEDEVVDAASSRATIRLVLPLVAPVLGVPAVLLFREPDNFVAFVSLLYGAGAILYAVLAELAERRLAQPFWIQLLNSLVYAGIISGVLWTLLTFDHPRPHAHWIGFFLYFLLVGATGLSDDPRQPLAAGAFSIAGYLVVVLGVEQAAASGRSAMAVALAPQLEWVAHSAKLALLGAVTVLAVTSARRGRAVRRMSLRDGLTGLLNRHAFDQCLERLAQRAERRGRPMTLAMIDIDHFKRLNDTHGHATGDSVLRWVVSWLQRGFRATDVVARYGGEEFVVAFLDTDDDRLCERLEALRHGIETTRLRDLDSEHDIHVTVSIGIASRPGDGQSVAEVLERADERLYAAKHQGRNRIVDADAAPGPAPAAGS